MRTFQEIARQEEHRQASGIALIAGEAEPLAGGFLCYTAPGSWSNQGFGLAMDGPVTQAQLDRVVDFYTERGCPARLEVSPYAHPTLLAGLAARGFSLQSFEHVLCRPLPAEEDLSALAPGTVDGLRLERVDRADEAEIAAHIAIIHSGFPLDDPQDPAGHALHVRMLKSDRFFALNAYIGGDIVGGASVEILGGQACLLGATVLPAWRRLGVQQALMVARMTLARARGARRVCVHSAPGHATERNAARMGFSVAYTKVEMMRPLPADRARDYARIE